MIRFIILCTILFLTNCFCFFFLFCGWLFEFMLNNLIGHQFYGFAVALNWKGFLATAFTPNPYPKKKE